MHMQTPSAPAARPTLELARQLMASNAPTPSAEMACPALAWALKEHCYEAWNTEPARAAHAAEVLGALAACSAATEHAVEIKALAQWSAGIAQVTRGRLPEAVLQFDAAAAAFTGIGLADAAAQTQVPKIMVLAMLGEHAAAAACAERTQAELLRLGNFSAASRVSLNLGGLHLHSDDYASAARHYREAAVLFARIGDHERSAMADHGLAGALSSMGDFDEALRIYARARMRAQRLGLEVLVALVDESVALLDLARGRYPQALAGLESVRQSYQRLAMPQHLATAEKQLADVYLELRLLPEALALFETAQTQFETLQQPVEQAWALAQTGRAQALLGRTARAGQAFGRAADLFAAQGNGVGSAAVALARAELALDLLDRQARVSPLQMPLQMPQPVCAPDPTQQIDATDLAAEDAVAPNPPVKPDTTEVLAWADEARLGFEHAGQVEGRARAELVRAHAWLLDGRVSHAAAAFTATLAQARALQQIQLQVHSLTGQGLSAQAGGDTPSAAAAFEAAIELFEDQRRALPGDELRSAFLSDHLRPYTERLRMALANGDAAAVLWQLERIRARALDQRLGVAVRGAEAAAPAACVTDHGLMTGATEPDPHGAQAQRTRLNWLYRRVQKLQDDGDSTTALQAELQRCERGLLERARRQRFGGESPVADSDTAFSVPALQAALGPHQALVEYGVVGDELLACVARREAVVLLRLGPWSGALAAVRALRFQLEALGAGVAALQPHLPQLTRRAQVRLSALHALIWSPLEATLQGADSALIVPQAELGAVPFAALGDGHSAPLGQRLQLALAPSARLALRGLGSNAAALNSKRNSDPNQNANPSHGFGNHSASARLLALGDSTRLPHAADEVYQVGRLFDNPQVFIGDRATLANLRLHAAQADVLHLACHGQFRSDSPRFSALHLHDGALTADEVETLRLPASTVVLSACDTGLAELATGDEMVGLVRAFLVAGAERVVASLWSVDDEATALFMGHFYRALQAGQRPAAALQAAQALLRATHPHPALWASFTLHGGW